MVGVDLLPEGAKGLVFDCDGTLVDSMEQHYIAWKATCDKFGLNEFTPKLIVENAGVPINDLFAIVLKANNKEGQVDREEVRYAHACKHPCAYLHLANGISLCQHSCCVVCCHAFIPTSCSPLAVLPGQARDVQSPPCEGSCGRWRHGSTIRYAYATAAPWK
jgi:hypothetical protein